MPKTYHPNGSALRADGWRRMPAVTPGPGPGYFYTRRHPHEGFRQWILFDRQRREWIRQDEDPATGATTSERL